MALLSSLLFYGLVVSASSLASKHQTPLGGIDHDGGKQDLIYEYAIDEKEDLSTAETCVQTQESRNYPNSHRHL